jgi:uncharacterized protein (DUF2267 family)
METLQFPTEDESLMQYDDFLEQVAQRTGLNRAHGDKAIVAVLETLSERIGSKEAIDLAAELPRQLQAVVAEAPEEPCQFPADDFVRKVAAREWVPAREARVHAKVVLHTLCQVVSKVEVKDLLRKLPPDYQSLWGESRSAPVAQQ